MRSANKHERRRAAESLGFKGNMPAIPYISGVLLNINEDLSVRVAAAQSLGRIADARAWPYLAQSASDLNIRIRFASIMALAQIPVEANVTLMARALRSDPSWWVRYAAATAMGSTQKTFTVGWLEQAAREDSVWQVRFQACMALGELKTPRAARALTRPLKDSDDSVRMAAAMALAQIGGRQSADILAQAIQTEKKSDVRASLIETLQQIENPEETLAEEREEVIQG